MNRRSFFQYILGGFFYLNLPFKWEKMPVKVTYIGVPKVAMSSPVHSVKEFFSKLLKVNIKNSVQTNSLQNKVLSINTKLYSSKTHSNKKMIKTEVIYKDSEAYAKSVKMWKEQNSSLAHLIQYTVVDVSYGIIV